MIVGIGKAVISVHNSTDNYNRSEDTLVCRLCFKKLFYEQYLVRHVLAPKASCQHEKSVSNYYTFTCIKFWILF